MCLPDGAPALARQSTCARVQARVPGLAKQLVDASKGKAALEQVYCAVFFHPEVSAACAASTELLTTLLGCVVPEAAPTTEHEYQWCADCMSVLRELCHGGSAAHARNRDLVLRSGGARLLNALTERVRIHDAHEVPYTKVTRYAATRAAELLAVVLAADCCVTSADLEPALGELVQGCLAVLVNRQNRMHAHARCVDAGMTAYHAPCVAEVLLVLAGHAKGRAALLAHGALQSLRFVVAEEEGAVAADYCACIISKVEADAPEGSLTLTRSTEARRKRRVIGPSKRGWVMISYQWAHQPLALALREELGRAGYSVWIDVEKMSGSIMAKMARRGPRHYYLPPPCVPRPR